MHRLPISLALFVGSIAVFAGRPARADISKQLNRGKIFSISVPRSSGIWPGRSMAVIDAPASQVYAILADFSSYDQFVPRIDRSRRLERGSYELLATLPWPIKQAKVTLKVVAGKRGKTRVVKWWMTHGSLHRYQGVAWIQPWGKNQTLLTYQMLAVPKGIAPAPMMATGLRKATAQVIRALRKRITLRTASRSF